MGNLTATIAGVTELCFVMSAAQNRFFVEIVEALRGELSETGVETSISTDGFPPPRDRLVYALFPPHEYVVLEGEPALPPADLLERTIYICAEQPGSVHFKQNVELARNRPPAAVFDINARSVKLFRQQEIGAKHLSLGYTPAWDRFDPAAERSVDVAFLGAQTARRLDYLRNAASSLSRRRCELRVSDNSRPNTGPSVSFVTGEQKLALLSRSRVLLNIHQGPEPYFEWTRIIEAIHCGAVVVSEHSTDYAPLVPGEHFLAGRPESLPLLAEALLDDESHRAAIAQAAYDFLRTEVPMSAGAVALTGVVREVADRPLTARSAQLEPRFRSGGRRNSGDSVSIAHAWGAASTLEQSLIRRNLRDLRLDTIELSRRLARVEGIARSGDGVPPPTIRAVAATAGWRGAQPRVTAVMPLHNQAQFVVGGLQSLVNSANPRQLEIVVINDGSTDGGDRVVLDWMLGHQSAAALLVEHPINRGLPHARNTGIDFARGRFCLMLDADNTVYPSCISRLADALDWDSEAAFAYCMLECFGEVDSYVQRGGTPVINQFGWDPNRLRNGNFIDAFAMIRRNVLREVGGYIVDPRTYGYEDYDLWCTIAEQGWRGLHVREILGRYRTSAVSMGGIMDLSISDSVGVIVERHPRLMRGVKVPS